MRRPSPIQSPASRRTQDARRDASERQLVEATLRVVAEQGVSKATFDEIGRAAGFSRGLATHKFGSKQGLTEAVLDYLHQRREAILEADHVAELPAFDAIVYFIDGHTRDLSSKTGGRAYFMLLAAAVADATALRAAFATSHERVRGWLRAQLKRGQASGDIRSDLDPDAAALMIGGLMLGLNLQWLVDPSTDLASIRQTCIATLRQSFAVDVAVRRNGRGRR